MTANIFGLLLLLTMSSTGWTEVNACVLALAKAPATAANPEAQALEAQYNSLLATSPDLKTVLPMTDIQDVLANVNMPYYTKNLAQLLSHVEADKGAATIQAKLTDAAKATLHGQVPDATIQTRIHEFFDPAHANDRHRTILRLLGDMERSEVLQLLYGADPAHPASDSLIGRYLSETGAQTLTRTFPVAPNSNDQGPARLVVSVSEASFESFKKYFFRPEFTSVIGHAYFVQNGRLNDYAHRDQEFRPQAPGNILPLLVFKTTEAQRLDLYFRALRHDQPQPAGWNDVAFQPWLMNYTPMQSAWITCTQWIGNVPIGDTLVKEWTLPGLPMKPDGNGGQNATPTLTPLQKPKTDDPLLQQVFTVPGHMQLSEVLGRANDNGLGNFANPGWVIQTLIGPVGTEFVPVVFLWAQDHKQPIAPAFVPVFERPM